MTEILYEMTNTANNAVRIDKEAGIIFGVKIIGCESRNGRHYPNETLRSAVPLYENSKVNLDHPDGDPRKPRSYHHRFGIIRNVQLREHDGLYADFWFNPKHPITEQLLWDAEHAPENVGFSHNVEAVVQRRSEPAIVEKIVAVRSVDLVADPAATQGLFETLQTENMMTREIVERLIDERIQLLEQRFRHEAKPQCREQFVTETIFDTKSFAKKLTNG